MPYVPYNNSPRRNAGVRATQGMKNIITISSISTLKLFKYFRGCKIDCPKFFYRQDYVVDAAAQIPDRRERAKVAVAAGYTANRLEVLLNQHRKRAI